MAVNFPSDPIIGQQVVGSNNVVYEWDGEKWRSSNNIGLSLFAVSSGVAPSGASNGDAWFDTASGIAYVYLIDGGTAEWTNIITDGIITPSKLSTGAPTWTSGGDFAVDTNTLYVDSTNNRVGLGTSAPSKLLHIATSSDNEGITLQKSSVSGSQGTRISFQQTNTSASSVEIAAIKSDQVNATAGSEAGGLTLFTKNTTDGSPQARLRITSTGAVGIGTTSPSANLHVAAPNNSQLFLQATDTDPTTIILETDAGASERIRINNKDGELTFDIGNTSESLRIDSSGRLLVGTSSARSNFFNGTSLAPAFQLEGAGAGSFASVVRNDNTTSGFGLVLGKSRSSSYAIVSNADPVGQISFQGADGSELVEAARIEAYVDGTPGANDMPGRLVFSTTADGASSPTERMRIDSTGYTRHAARGASLVNYGHEFSDDATNTITLTVNQRNSGFVQNGGGMLFLNCARAASSAYTFVGAYSGDITDREFNLRGDGNGYADGSWTGGGADYAEYFEWSDLNPNDEDRRGISVVLDGGKIREAQPGEDPIGVISGNPSVVGDAAWNKWNGKYLRDEFGTYIQEDYEVEDEDGNTVIQQCRTLNPAYDPDQEYIPREQRPEWDCVGLMGKLRIRKGQVTGSRWIKMRDISDSVEEWLVR